MMRGRAALGAVALLLSSGAGAPGGPAPRQVAQDRGTRAAAFDPHARAHDTAGGDAHAQEMAGRAAPTEAPALAVHLAQVTPTVAVPGRPSTLVVRVTNRSDAAVRGVLLRVRRGERALRTREETQRWDAEGVVPGRLVTLAQQPIPGSIAPGSTASMGIRLPTTPLPADPYGAAPLELEAVVGDRAERRRTFLSYFRIKEYTQLDMAFVAPLTGDANPALYSTAAAERAAAWTRLAGPGGRLSRIIDGTGAAPVTLMVDPAVLGAPSAATDEPNPPGSGPTTPSATATTPPPSSAPGSAVSDSPGPRPTSTSPTTPAAITSAAVDGGDSAEVNRLQDALAARIEGERGRRPVWLLPTGDPDLTALVAHPHAEPLLRRLLTPVAGSFGDRAPRVAWPVGSHVDEGARAAIAAAYGPTPPALFLASIGPLDHSRASQASAPHRDAAGRLVLGYDRELSRLWGSLAVSETTVETTQRFLAESAALLAQSPSRRRSVLVVAPRLLDVDPTAMRAFLDAVRATPWVRAVSAETLRGSQAAALPSTDDARAPDHVSQPAQSPATTGGRATDPVSPLTGADAGLIESQRRDLRGIRSILTEPDPAVRALQRGADSLAATVWRYDQTGWGRLRAAQIAGVRRFTTGVSVRPSTVNFFADNGVLQVTVVNNLDRDVRGLTLTLNPEGRASRLRILHQPDPVQIRRNSRTTVRANVEAIAAGAVPVSTRLTTPEGTTLGNDATVRVTVQPTNGWTVLAVGGLAGVVFLAGLYRTLRGGRPRMTHEELNRIDLT